MRSFITIIASLICIGFAKECNDKNSLCPTYAKLGYCEKERSNMAKTCPKSCNFCGETGKSTSAPQAECGRPVNQQSRIIGGENAKKDAWPWQVGLYYNGQFLCGGSVITPTWILTAAHCVDGFSYSYYQVVVGDFNRNDVSGNEQVYRAKRAFHHPDWMSPSQLNNDVALIELDEPIRFNAHVQPICLPNREESIAVGKKCYVTGWGQYTIGRAGPPTVILKQSSLNVVSQSACFNLNTETMGIPITDKMVCAGYGPQNRDSACHGDSGGPFVCQEDDGRWVLQGSVSWGSGTCRSSEGYSVFAKISEFRNWIDSYVLGGSS